MANWPTALSRDGSAPPLLQLLGSDDEVVRRQAAFTLFAGKTLKEGGYSIEGFQLPVEDPSGGGVTVPFMMKNPRGLSAVVYTHSEPWTEAGIRDLLEWMKRLRALGLHESVPILVACQWTPPAQPVAGVFQFLHLPQENLPGSNAAKAKAAPAATNDEGTPAEAPRLAARFVEMAHEKGQGPLDYSPQSLAVVDTLLGNARQSGLQRDEASGWIYAAGCYIGEVFVRNAGAAWRPLAEIPGMSKVCSWPIALRTSDGSGLNPIGKAFKRFDNGEGDSVAFFWKAFTSMKRS